MSVIRAAEYLDPRVTIKGVPTLRGRTMTAAGEVDGEERIAKGALFLDPGATIKGVPAIQMRIPTIDGSKVHVLGAYIDAFGVRRWRSAAARISVGLCGGVYFPDRIFFTVPCEAQTPQGLPLHLMRYSAPEYAWPNPPVGVLGGGGCVQLFEGPARRYGGAFYIVNIAGTDDYFGRLFYGRTVSPGCNVVHRQADAVNTVTIENPADPAAWEGVTFNVALADLFSASFSPTGDPVDTDDTAMTGTTSQLRYSSQACVTHPTNLGWSLAC